MLSPRFSSCDAHHFESGASAVPPLRHEELLLITKEQLGYKSNGESGARTATGSEKHLPTFRQRAHADERRLLDMLELGTVAGG